MVKKSNDDMKEFEEEFDFESDDSLHDELPLEEEEALTNKKNEPYASSQQVGIERKGSKLPWLIGLVAAGFVGWQGYKMIFPQPKEDLSVAPANQEKQVAKSQESSIPPQSNKNTTPATLPPTHPTQSQTTVPSVPPVPSADQQKTPDLFTPPAPVSAQSIAPTPKAAASMETTLEENLKKSQERLGKLESKFTDLMDSMGNLNQGMSQVTRELSTINDSVQNLNKEVKTLKSQTQPTPTQVISVQTTEKNNKNETKSPEASPIVGSTQMMSVHAIIPGRAWLKSRDGSTITVTEGDTLDRYGKVLVIDAANGVVITSSGVTLR